jgi:hypothetical protein
LGLAPNHPQVENRPERMTNNNNLVFPETFAQILYQLDSILRHAIERHRRCNRLAGFSERSTRAPLVPLDNCETRLPGSEHSKCSGIRHVSGSSVQKQQHGVGAVLPTDGDPLFDAS